MPVDVSALNASIAALVAQVSKTEGTEASAGALIAGFAAQITKAVDDAIRADNAISNEAIPVVNKAIEDVTARFAASDASLGAAVAIGSPTPTTVPPVTP